MRYPTRFGFNYPSPRSAIAATELVIILPVLLTILLGCVDFGRFAYSHIAVTNAARAGADFASTNKYTTTGATAWQAKVKQAVVNDLAQLPGFDATKLSVSAPAPVADGNLKLVSVQASYPFKTIITWPKIPKQVTLTRTVKMRVIR